jgi:predicted RNA polymerase sigma factor
MSSQESHLRDRGAKVVSLLPSAGDPYNHEPALLDSARRRRLDDMRRLSEEIKLERARSAQPVA